LAFLSANQQPCRPHRLQGLNPELPNLLQFEDDNIETTQQPILVEEHNTILINRKGVIEYGFVTGSEDGSNLSHVDIQSRIHISHPLSLDNLITPVPDTSSPNSQFCASLLHPLRISIQDPHTPEVVPLTTSEDLVRGPYHFHYSHLITHTNNPHVVQLPGATTAPWKNNPWYQEILRDTRNVQSVNIVRSASSSFPSSPSEPTMMQLTPQHGSPS